MAFLNWLLPYYKKREKAILPDPYETRREVLPSFRETRDYTSQEENLLKVDLLTLSFGGLQVLKQVSINIKPNLIHAIIGPNGAGKTSLLNCICRVYEPQQGKISFLGKDLDNLRPDQAAKLGIARAFQQIELFAGMTVIDNIMLGRHIFLKNGIFRAGFWLPGLVKEEIINRKMVEEVIEFLHLEAYRNLPVGTLPYGVQKRVDLGRALAMSPKILLLDEPCAGMNQEETEDMARFVLDIRDELDLTVVIIEHNMNVIMDISDRISVLNFGVLIAEGTPDEIQKNPEVMEAYLGSKEAI